MEESGRVNFCYLAAVTEVAHLGFADLGLDELKINVDGWLLLRCMLRNSVTQFEPK